MGKHDLSKETNLNQEELEVIDMSLKKQGQGKNSGFSHSHAKSKYKANHFRSLNGNIDGLTKRDPHRAYKLISWNEFRSNGFRDNRGWIPLTQKNKSVENFPEPNSEFGIDVQTDGFWHVGDLIWAFKPIDDYALDRAKLFERNKIRTTGVTKEFRKQSKALSDTGNDEMVSDIEDIEKRI